MLGKRVLLNGKKVLLFAVLLGTLVVSLMFLASLDVPQEDLSISGNVAFRPVPVVQPESTANYFSSATAPTCSDTEFIVVERPGNVAVDYVRAGAQSQKELIPGVKKVSFSKSRAPAALQALSANKKVKSIEPECFFPVARAPNDAYYPVNQPQLRQMKLDLAWDSSIGSAYVRVANPDTGQTLSHPDLVNIYVPSLARNTVDGTSNVTDIHGHGTSTAGALGAETDNTYGIASGPWSTSGKIGIIPIKISNSADGSASSSAAVNAIRYAADNGAKVVTVSYGFGGYSAIDSAGDYLRSKGGLLFVSAGNQGVNSTSENFDGILVVSAIQADEQLYSWSSYGSFVDFAAPGCTMVTTKTGGYGTGCGTSFSSPLAASVAALLFSAYPGVTPLQVETAMKEGAFDSYVPGVDHYTGFGRVDARGAMIAMGAVEDDTTPPRVFFVNPANNSVISSPIVILVSATDSSGVRNVELSIDNVFFANSTSPDANGYYSFAWDPASYAVGSHSLTAKAFDLNGNTALVTIPVSVQHDSTAPSVSFVSPAFNATLSCPSTIRVQATDANGISRVELYLDSSFHSSSTAGSYNIYSFPLGLSGIANGQHSLIAKAFDTGNNENSASTQVNVAAEQAPFVLITSPLAGSTVNSKTTFTASASNNTMRVEFYVNNTLKATDMTVPYSFKTNLNQYKRKAILVTAKAFNCNNASTSASAQYIVA